MNVVEIDLNHIKDPSICIRSDFEVISIERKCIRQKKKTSRIWDIFFRAYNCGYQLFKASIVLFIMLSSFPRESTALMIVFLTLSLQLFAIFSIVLTID